MDQAALDALGPALEAEDPAETSEEAEPHPRRAAALRSRPARAAARGSAPAADQDDAGARPAK